MTHAMSAAVDQALAAARNDADDILAVASELPDVDRARRVAAVAVDLLDSHGIDYTRLAYTAAELAVRTVEHATPADPAAPIDLVPDTGVRLAFDYPGYGG
jgi:hypothetical protein